MDQTAMVAATLTEDMIAAGKALLQKLDQSHERVKSAVWYLEEDGNVWKLLLSQPNLVKFGPKLGYRKVQSALRRIGPHRDILSLDDIVLVRENEPLLMLLKAAVRIPAAPIGGVRFTNNVINGIRIADAYIYRVQ